MKTILSIIFSLYLTVSCFAQATPMSATGGTTCLSRTHTAHPSCVYEQTARPFSSYRLGDIMEHEDCSDPDLYHYQSGSWSPCYANPLSWIRTGGPMDPHVLMVWAPDGNLFGFGSSVTRIPRVGLPLAGVTAGWWGSQTVPNMTWDQFRTGTSLMGDQRWLTGNEWIYMTGIPDYVCFEDFLEIYGFYPWDAVLRVRVDYLQDITPPVHDFEWLGSRISLTIDVLPEPHKADYNRDGTTNIEDVFSFLSAWFAQWPRGDFNSDYFIEVDDIFVFLVEWFNDID